MNLQRGVLRLAISLVALWFVFWTFAYVLVPRGSENQAPAGPAFSSATDFGLIASGILLALWVVAGFRSD